MTIAIWIQRMRPVAVLALGLILAAPAAHPQTSPSLKTLLPQPAGWKPSEAPRSYDVLSLFEFIDGAAEAYLGYDFKELLVGQYQSGTSKATMTVELYDMGTPLNAFGIYGAERFPESRFLPIGVQGYMEEGSLNFLSGRFYVKLMCYEAGEKAGEMLNMFAKDIAAKVKEPGSFPALLQVFPGDGLVRNSEKFFVKNFMGFKFLANGYSVAYALNGQEFDAFLLEAKSPGDAEAMLTQYVENFRKNGQVEKTDFGVRIKDPYLKTVFAARSGRYVCGVTKVKDGQTAAGQKVLEMLVKDLAKK